MNRVAVLGLGGGADAFTVIVTLAVALLYVLVSFGVNDTDKVCVPASSTVPEGGLYANVPGTLAVAFSCADPNGVGLGIGAGAGQLIVGVVFAGLGVGDVDAVEDPPQDINVVKRGIKTASEIRRTKNCLLRNTAPRKKAKPQWLAGEVSNGFGQIAQTEIDQT